MECVTADMLKPFNISVKSCYKGVVGQFEIQVNNSDERISRWWRKGVKKSRQRMSGIQSFAVFLCAFAPLRETSFLSFFKLTHYL